MNAKRLLAVALPVTMMLSSVTGVFAQVRDLTPPLPKAQSTPKVDTVAPAQTSETPTVAQPTRTESRTETKVTPAQPANPPAVAQAPAVQGPSTSSTVAETRNTETIQTESRPTIFGMDYTTAAIIGSVLVLVMILAMVAVSQSDTPGRTINVDNNPRFVR